MLAEAEERLRDHIAALCDDACAGRATGTPGGALAKRRVADALTAVSARPREHAVVASGGTNLVCELGPGERAILVGAHFDHLGSGYPGADDNAAAVAVLIELARALYAAPPVGARRVILCAFDAEEPPHFLGDGMGSIALARDLAVESIDLMVALDLVGHAPGVDGDPPSVRSTLLALGAERSEALPSLLGALPVEPGLTVRRAGANLVPPLSDYHAFAERRVPYLFLTGGRNRHYHEPTDTPDRIDLPRLAAFGRWLERLVRAAAALPAPNRFLDDGRDDATTIATLRALSVALAPRWPDAPKIIAGLDALAAAAARGPLSPAQFGALRQGAALVEWALA